MIVFDESDIVCPAGRSVKESLSVQQGPEANVRPAAARPSIHWVSIPAEVKGRD